MSTKIYVDYVKHLVECKCVLPQFKNINPPRWHQFVVFSTINEHGDINPSFTQCNNCGTIHKVTEVGTSTILNKDDLPSLPTKEELKETLPEKIAEMLEKYNCELPTYQEVAFIFENHLWGRSVILTKDVVDNIKMGKYLTIFGETLWKINNFQEELNNE